MNFKITCPDCNVVQKSGSVEDWSWKNSFIYTFFHCQCGCRWAKTEDVVFNEFHKVMLGNKTKEVNGEIKSSTAN